jgi:hypothetical protein
MRISTSKIQSHGHIEREQFRLYKRRSALSGGREMVILPPYIGNACPKVEMGPGYANSVFVHEGDIYVAGQIYCYGGYEAVLWKNGKMQWQQEMLRGSSANSVFVDGKDVYAVGTDDYLKRAILWKNGTAHNVVNKTNTSASSVFVSGQDVYVAGLEGDMAVLWENGVCHYLNFGSDFTTVNSVAVSGKDVYVVGQTDYVAVLWKNGMAHYLPCDDDFSSANSVFVDGKDVYVAGYDGSVAVLWKNGIKQGLTRVGG